jgi:hypothetical protein
MDFRTALLEGLTSDIEQEVTESSGSPELRTGCYPLDKSASLVDGRLI